MNGKCTCMFLVALVASVLIWSADDAFAQTKGDDRMREMQRRLQAALKKSEDEKAALGQEIEALRRKLVDAELKDELLAKERVRAFAESRRAQALGSDLHLAQSAVEAEKARTKKLQGELAERERQIRSLQDKLRAAEAGLEERAAQARSLVARTAAHERKAGACEAANTRLRNAGLSCIARFEANVIPGMEALLQFERVRMENELEAIRDEIDAATLVGDR